MNNEIRYLFTLQRAERIVTNPTYVRIYRYQGIVSTLTNIAAAIKNIKHLAKPMLTPACAIILICLNCIPIIYYSAVQLRQSTNNSITTIIKLFEEKINKGTNEKDYTTLGSHISQLSHLRQR